jgi:hypothetical protein
VADDPDARGNGRLVGVTEAAAALGLPRRTLGGRVTTGEWPTAGGARARAGGRPPSSERPVEREAKLAELPAPGFEYHLGSEHPGRLDAELAVRSHQERQGGGQHRVLLALALIAEVRHHVTALIVLRLRRAAYEVDHLRPRRDRADGVGPREFDREGRVLVEYLPEQVPVRGFEFLLVRHRRRRPDRNS